MKYYFVYKETDLSGKETGKTITHQFNASVLSEMLENFEDFLKGCGYCFDGVVDITNNDDDCTSDSSENEHSDYYYDFERNKHTAQAFFNFEETPTS